MLEDGRKGFRRGGDGKHAKSLEVHRTHKGGFGEHDVPDRNDIGSGLPGVALNVGLPKVPVQKPLPGGNVNDRPLGSQLQGRIPRPDIVARVCDDVLSVVARCTLEHLGELPVVACRNVNRLIVAGCRVRLKDAGHIPNDLVEEVARRPCHDRPLEGDQKHETIVVSGGRISEREHRVMLNVVHTDRRRMEKRHDRNLVGLAVELNLKGNGWLDKELGHRRVASGVRHLANRHVASPIHRELVYAPDCLQVFCVVDDLPTVLVPEVLIVEPRNQVLFDFFKRLFVLGDLLQVFGVATALIASNRSLISI